MTHACWMVAEVDLEGMEYISFQHTVVVIMHAHQRLLVTHCRLAHLTCAGCCFEVACSGSLSCCLLRCMSGCAHSALRTHTRLSPRPSQVDLLKQMCVYVGVPCLAHAHALCPHPLTRQGLLGRAHASANSSHCTRLCSRHPNLTVPCLLSG